ncbi:hypothetical protein WPS_02250 [Vulcanimicrobium alpinum]|uniref:Uncharacterized protein n=1 Tax=Vulcanimicrobium alpinum TaxID=3016050 RepID=A0AAN2C808_UNVUL|nr:hypothetical protein [Vulcanimicrobium alpinum]BDE04949.1 hypothetical protein WPS_02250 [Vulcanimicrobium alpinum]
MLVFDLSHDRMAAVPFQAVADVQAALIFDEDRYRDAGHQIGLNDAEFNEFEGRVFDGKVTRTHLPLALDAMAGQHRGRVYAIKSVQVRPGEWSYLIALSDGKRVYVPVKCGNLSLVRRPAPAVVAHVPAHHRTPQFHPRVAAAHVVAPPAPKPPQAAPPAASAPVAFLPPVETAVAAPVAPVAAAAGHHSLFVPFFAWLAGSIGHTVGNNSQPPASCSTSDHLLEIC